MRAKQRQATVIGATAKLRLCGGQTMGTLENFQSESG
jgi:hypothetical protein